MEANRLYEGNLKALKDALEMAIDAENYELCADIRDQITEAEKISKDGEQRKLTDKN